MKDLLIVVPYRDREEHLKTFLEKVPLYFNNQKLTYDILICELDNKGDWNAGLTINSLSEYVKDKNYKWLYIHHVDVYPLTGAWEFPGQGEYYFNLGDYGSCLMSFNDFMSVGGYSNDFWGWGGEDNDLYNKLSLKGLKKINKENGNINYDKGYQNHPRKFNAKNYAHGLKNLYLLPEEKKTNITHFPQVGSVERLEQISDNIYKQKVVPKIYSPSQHKNNKLLIGYIKGVTNSDYLMPYIKSALLFSSYEYDMCICVADESPNSHVLNQLEAFGVTVYKRICTEKSLFIDRYIAYKEFLSANKQYDTVLHVDVLDAIFQSNPFEYISDQIVLTSEDMTIGEEKWNASMMKNIYGRNIFDDIKNDLVICGGVVGGPINDFIKFCDKVLDESKKLNYSSEQGYDQTIIQKLMFYDKTLKADIKKLKDGFCCNLHVFYNYNDIIKNKIKVINENKWLTEDNKKFSIVHQYTRNKQIYSKIYNFFIKYFHPIL